MDRNDPLLRQVEADLDELYWLVFLSALLGKREKAERQKALIAELTRVAKSGQQYLYMEIPQTLDAATSAGSFVRSWWIRNTSPRFTQ